MTKPTFNTDFDGIVFEVEKGVALTMQPSKFGNIKELPPGTLILEENSPYLNGLNKNSKFVCTNINLDKMEFKGYCVNDKGEVVEPDTDEVTIIVDTEDYKVDLTNYNLIKTLTRLAPFVGKDNFKNLVSNDNNLYHGDSFREPFMQISFVKTNVPGLYQVANNTYQWLDADRVDLINKGSTYGIIPSTEKYTPIGDSLDEFMNTLVNAVQCDRTNTPLTFSEYVPEKQREDATEKLSEIIEANNKYYEVDTLKTIPFNTGIRLNGESLEGDLAIVEINHQSKYTPPFAVTISEKDFVKYFDAYEHFCTSGEKDNKTLKDHAIDIDNGTATDAKTVTLSGTRTAFGETLYWTEVSETASNNIAETMYCRIKPDIAEQNQDAVSNFTNIIELSENPCASVFDCEDALLRDQIANVKSIYRANKIELPYNYNLQISPILNKWDEYNEFMENNLESETDKDFTDDFDDYE
jgi:hypothetical protein